MSFLPLKPSETKFHATSKDTCSPRDDISIIGGVAYIPTDGWGKSPVGLITYSTTGIMSANIAATEPEWRPQALRFPPQSSDSEFDWNLVGRHTLGYAGPFSFNESVPVTKTHGQIIHGPLTVASTPYLEGEILARDYVVKKQDGVTYLYLYARGVVASGVPLVTELVWDRIAKE